MANSKLIGWIVMWFGLALGLALGFFIAYMVHVQWHFFGATFVTLKGIVGVWVLIPAIVGFCGFYLGAVIGDRI